jgi:hypothetical protein
MCPCGKPLHYIDPYVEEFVCKLIALNGEYITIVIEGKGEYELSRHYLALHGFKAVEVDDLERQGIIKKIK